MSNESPPGTTDDAVRIRAALEQLLSQPAFMRAPQMSSFLRYVVEQTLQGDAERIKAYTIGVDALGKASNFDPQTDPSVRVLAKRLRDRLREHYAHHIDAPLRIELVSGSYTPRFIEPDEGLANRASDRRDQPGYGPAQEPWCEPAFRVQKRAELHPAAALAVAHVQPRAPGAEPRAGGPPVPPDARNTRAQGLQGAAVLYLVASQEEDRLAQDIAFLLSGMLARLHGTDARRVTRTPATFAADDRSLTVHVTRLGNELRVDLQVCRGRSGEILSADVLALHPSEDDTLSRGDLDRLERWASHYAAHRLREQPAAGTSGESARARPETAPPGQAATAPREPLAGWLANGRTSRVDVVRDDAATPRQSLLDKRVLGQ